MRARSGAPSKSLQEQSELLREVGLGGSAVGTGINTHPDYRAKAVAELSRISGEKLDAVDDMRYAMQSNLRDVEHQLRTAQSGAGGDPHLE